MAMKLALAIAYQLLLLIIKVNLVANRSFSSYECAEEEVAICRKSSVRESYHLSFSIASMA